MRFAGVPLALFVVMCPYVGLMVGQRLGQDSAHPFLQHLWQGGDCDWSALGRALARLPGEGPGNIATYANAGPELADMSGLGVVATGCHCNAEGMRDARAILLSTSDVARVVAERREVEFVVQCPSVRGWQGHDWYIEWSEPDGTYARLARGDPPYWLYRVPASELGVEGFVVHRTAFAARASASPAPAIAE